jgi:hypothetical protein
MTDNSENDPAWLDPTSDRETPYTDEEIEAFANDFIAEFPEEHDTLVKDDGPNTAKIVLRNRLRARDPNGAGGDF